MSPNVVSIRDTSTREEAARLLAQHHITGLPVVDTAGKLVGLVSEYDLIAKSGALVVDLMSRGVISVGPATDVEEVVHLLAHSHIRRVPVLDGDQMVGIVSRSDLVRQIAMRWVCPVCGEVLRGVDAPDQCPRCHAGASAFIREVELPGV